MLAVEAEIGTEDGGSRNAHASLYQRGLKDRIRNEFIEAGASEWHILETRIRDTDYGVSPT